MREYPSKKIVIDSLTEVHPDMLSDDTYFEYKGIHFFFKKNTNKKNLLVAFHGAVKFNRITKTVEPNLPIFRFSNYRNKKYNVLSISDKNLETYAKNKLLLSWYLPIKSFDHEEVYKEIVNHFIQSHEKITFSGSSGGGFPALKFGCMFKQNVLMQNSQLYLTNHPHYKIMLKNIYPDLPLELDITDVLKKYGEPKYAKIFQNSMDAHHFNEHFTPFKNFIISNGLQDKFCFEEFSNTSPNTGNHNVRLPKNITQEFLIEDMFKD